MAKIIITIILVNIEIIKTSALWSEMQHNNINFISIILLS